MLTLLCVCVCGGGDYIESKKQVLSLGILREPLLKFLAFSVNYTLPYLPNLSEMD